VLLLLKAGDPAAAAAFGDGGSLQGNVEGFKANEQAWADFELQAMAAVVYGGLVESEDMLDRAKEVLCKVSERAGGVDMVAKGELLMCARYKRMHSTDWMLIPGWPGFSWMPSSP
jgi:hypothetical protein